jgi:hypothetical protein
MMKIAKFLFFILLIIQCEPKSSDEQMDVAILGDMPYVTKPEEFQSVNTEYQRVLSQINSYPAEFIVHVGDITAQGFCHDSVYIRRYNEFTSLNKPIVYLPGDNDWTDCPNPKDRLEKLRSTFMKEELTKQLSITRQEGYPENVYWEMNSIAFIGLHIVGSNNNFADSTEFASRNKANTDWLDAGFKKARDGEKKGVAIFLQANPNPGGARAFDEKVPEGFKPFVMQLTALVASYPGQVAMIHGDTHHFRIDMPLNGTNGKVMTNFIRAETFGSPHLHWMIMHIRPNAKKIFSFEPVL